MTHGRLLGKSHAMADTSPSVLSLRDIALVSQRWGLYNGAAIIGAYSHLEPEMALQRPFSHPWKERLLWHGQTLSRTPIPRTALWGILPPSRPCAPRSATSPPLTS